MENTNNYRGQPGNNDLVFNLSPDPILCIGFDGSVQRANPALLDVLDYSGTELSGLPIRSLLHSEDIPGLQAAFERLASGGGGGVVGARLVARDGEIRHFQWNLGHDGTGCILAIGRESAGTRLDGDWAADGVESACWAREVDEPRWEVGKEPPSHCSFSVLCERMRPGDRTRLRSRLHQVFVDGEGGGREIGKAAGPQLPYRKLLDVTFDMVVDKSDKVIVDVDGKASRLLRNSSAESGGESKLARMALRAREHYFETIAKVAPVGIYQLDRRGYAIYANARCAEIIGDSDILGWEMTRHIHPRDRGRVVKAWRAAIKEQHPFAIEFRFQRPDGSVAWVLSQAMTERNEAGDILGYIGALIDVTPYKELTEQLLEAEDRARRVAELAFDIILIVNAADQRIMGINPVGARLLGGRREDFIGSRIGDLYPDDFREEIRHRIARGIDGWHPSPLIECHLRRRDGVIIDVEGAAIPIVYRGDLATYMVYRDIGERKAAERALRQRHHQLATLAKAAPVGIFQIDPESRCSYVNERFLEITGFDFDETRDRLWWNHVVPEDRPGMQRQWQLMVEHGGRFNTEYRVRRKDGRIIWVLGQAVPETGESGQVLGYIGSITDIDQNKLNELELRNYREHLEDMVRERTLELEVVNRELESFSYSVSHDLRAPLRAINGFNEVLMNEYSDRLDEEARHFLGRIRINSRQMSELIDHLLELSKVTQAELKREWVDMSAMAEGVLNGLRLAEPERRVETVVEPELSAFADPRLLQSVLHNLLQNAWKYTGQCEAARIEFGSLWNGGVRTFFVRDNGAGFDMECTAKLFRAFHRLHEAREYEGNGIGLATVHRIVTRHGGRIWAEGEKGKGATFYFVLDRSS